MSEIAHLTFHGGGLFLPASSPYERELLVECVAATSKRHGLVRLEVGGLYWTIRRSASLRSVCDSCSRWPEDLAYPGGTSGALAVVSSLATACAQASCERAQAEAGRMDGKCGNSSDPTAATT